MLGEARGRVWGVHRGCLNYSMITLMIKLQSYSRAMESEIENCANILDQRGENMFTA